MAMTRRTHPRPIRYLFFVLVVFLGNCIMQAQVASGNIAGVITDPTGAARLQTPHDKRSRMGQANIDLICCQWGHINWMSKPPDSVLLR
jgi:hypothetical protein